MPDLLGGAQVEQMFTKQIEIGHNVYQLVAIKNKGTRWRWVGLLMKDDEVLEHKIPFVNERAEAMKDAHFLANFRERLPEDYPGDYENGWREEKVLTTGFIV